MKIIVALIVFSVIIIIHELGHFLLAKKNGIVVEEFSLGMGPRLLSFEAGGTRYSWKLLPFGGSCLMLGEDGEDMSEGSFGSRPVGARIAVVAAGPLFNFLLAFVLAIFIIGNIGYDAPIIKDVTDGYPAQEAGLRAGDRITKMNGKRIRLYRQFSNYGMFHEGEAVVFEYERDGETHETTVKPILTDRGYKYGITGSVNYARVRTNPIQTLAYSAYEVYYWIDTTLQSLKMLLRGNAGLDDMSGPVGVVQVIGDTNLGVMNLLPLPALDGGRLVFLIIEAVRGKRVDPELEARVHFTGLMLLMLLMVFVMFNDFHRIFA